MIVSHRHRFIFIKTAKTAGTSVEIALSQQCGPEDIITPLSPPDEALRRELNYPQAQNHLAKWSEMTDADVDALFERRVAKAAFLSHMGAEAARLRLGTEVWNAYFKFTIERNPWDKIVSFMHWLNAHGAGRELEELILSEDAFGCRGFPLYTIDEQLAVDRLLRFENLDADIRAVAFELGMPRLGPLPRAKSTYRQDTRGHRELMNEDLRERVAMRCAPEIALMGYEF